MALMYQTGNRTWGEPMTAGFLGTKHNPFNLVGRKAREKSDNMVLHGITLERLRDREQLRKAARPLPSRRGRLGEDGGFDTSMQQAMGILTDSKLGDALDLSKEDPRIVERYGKSDERFNATAPRG